MLLFKNSIYHSWIKYGKFIFTYETTKDNLFRFFSWQHKRVKYSTCSKSIKFRICKSDFISSIQFVSCFGEQKQQNHGKDAMNNTYANELWNFWSFYSYASLFLVPDMRFNDVDNQVDWCCHIVSEFTLHVSYWCGLGFIVVISYAQQQLTMHSLLINCHWANIVNLRALVFRFNG